MEEVVSNGEWRKDLLIGKDPVSEGRFPVIDVRDNRKVPDVSLQIPALPHKTASL